MKLRASPLLLLLTPHRTLAQDINDPSTSYITSVCSPATPPDQSAAAPCVAIQTIETACLPNGTSSLALEAHAQCLCHGSYFAEWLGCRRCLRQHGALTPQNYTYYSSVLSLASKQLCTGTPTAAFATLFTEAQYAVPQPTADGGPQVGDLRSGDAAVSWYYTASGQQGPGVITGSATAATTRVSYSAPYRVSEASGSVGTSGSTDAGVAASTTASTEGALVTSGSSSSPTSSSSIAAATGVAGGAKGVLFAAAAVGGALVAAL